VTTPPLRAAAVLFDMDGVLVDSRAAIDRVRTRWAEKHGLDPKVVIALPHGQKTRDIIATLTPHLDVRAEVAWLDADELRDLEGITAIPGAARLLGELRPDEWTVVTSSGRELASRRLAAAGLPVPDSFVSGEAVSQGKPAPEGYLLGASLLGRQPAECVVIEDAPAGVAAGIAAGMRVVGLTTTYPRAQLDGCTVIVKDLSKLAAERDGSRLHLVLRARD